MKYGIIIFLLLNLSFQPVLSQNEGAGNRILFHGLVMDATSLEPVSNSQIMINRAFSAVSRVDGTFAFYVNKHDSVIFNSLGYKESVMYISDTLSGMEFNAGIFMSNDTLSIGEVIIIPRFSSLKSDLMNAKSKTSVAMENAKYNVAVSGYLGRTTQGDLGDPLINYQVLRQKQSTDAYERGGIPSDQMVGINPFILLPAAYLLIHGLPEPPASFAPQLSNTEIDQIHAKYLESVRQKK